MDRTERFYEIDHLIRELGVVPVGDFLRELAREILSSGLGVKAISPERLKQEIAEMLRKALEQYE